MSDPTKSKTLKLNPADVTVDESMPRYPMSFSPKPKLSDEEVAVGKPLRLAARNKVSDYLNRLLEHEKGEKNYIKQNWSKEYDDRRKNFQMILDLKNSPANKKLISYIKTELVWWDNNKEVTADEVNERLINYDDTIDTLEKEAREYRPQDPTTRNNNTTISKPNPADLVVDESMPSYPISFTSTPKLSDEEVAAGKPLRLAARKKVQDLYNMLLNDEKTFKKNLKDGLKDWDKFSQKDKQEITNSLNLFNARKPLMNFLKTELVWWENNIELSTRQVNARDIKYDETSTKLLEAARNFRPEDPDTSASDEEEKRLEKLRNATIYDDITESLSTMAKMSFFLIYLIVALRCASFAVNENLHKGVPYRILIFIYTFLFVPIFGPYYLWKGIKSYIWNTPLPPYEGFFPLYPYDKSEPLTLNRRLYGYIDSPELQARIEKQKNDDIGARDAAVISKGLREKIIAEHSV
jgi:hypothetical protein